jgi:CheY-like chemotaxis protein
MKTSTDSSTAPLFRILLIDDNRHGLLVRKCLLQERGHQVISCSSPEEALAAFEQTEFDLVVTDYRMPKMSGTELIRVIRQKKPNTPVVLISGMVKVLGLNEENTGADEVVAKDGNEVNHIVRAVDRLLRRTKSKPPAPALGQSTSSNSRRRRQS